MGYSFLPEEKHKIILLYKMINGLCPDYLCSLVHLLFELIQHITSVMHLIIRSNNQLYYNSFLPSVVRDWNELPHTTRDATSVR